MTSSNPTLTAVWEPPLSEDVQSLLPQHEIPDFVASEALHRDATLDHRAALYPAAVLATSCLRGGRASGSSAETAAPRKTKLALCAGIASLVLALPLLASRASEETAPAVAGAPLSSEGPETTDTADPRASLAAIPGLLQRLETYIAARRERTTELAERYQLALEARFNQAADSGDLVLTRAYQEEKGRLAELWEALAVPYADPAGAVAIVENLPGLPGDSPETLASLRGVWDGEYAKLREELDGQLLQYLQALEAELTRARDLEGAGAILAYREGLGHAAEPAVVSASSTPAPPSSAQAGDPDLARASKDTPFENSLGMKFVPVPGTDVLFCIHATRYRDYEEYARQTREGVDGSWKNQTHDGIEVSRADDHPVTMVNWEDAKKFCDWLSEREGRTYRLPTDREWSFAVGIGEAETWEANTTPATVFKVPDIFPWGTDWPPPAGAGNYSDQSRRARMRRDDLSYLEGYDDGFPTTAPVMSFAPNEHGLYDLGGNVWELCEDWWTDEQDARVYRGASWGDHARSGLLSSYRFRDRPERRSSYRGFRLVLVPASDR